MSENPTKYKWVLCPGCGQEFRTIRAKACPACLKNQDMRIKLKNLKIIK